MLTSITIIPTFSYSNPYFLSSGGVRERSIDRGCLGLCRQCRINAERIPAVHPSLLLSLDRLLQRHLVGGSEDRRSALSFGDFSDWRLVIDTICLLFG